MAVRISRAVGEAVNGVRPDRNCLPPDNAREFGRRQLGKIGALAGESGFVVADRERSVFVLLKHKPVVFRRSDPEDDFSQTPDYHVGGPQ